MNKYLISYLTSFPREGYRRLYRIAFGRRPSLKRYANREVCSIEEGNALISAAILNSKPYMVSRFGANELNLAIDALVFNRIRADHLHTMKTNAGFFPENNETGFRFGECLKEASSEIDVAALFYSSGEEFFLSSFAPNAKLTNNRAIEPYYSMERPWSLSLKGKKVLVIHPFENTIINQYRKRDKIWSGLDILPDFELKVIKAVQTIAGATDPRFVDWFEALEWMTDEASKIDFDVAIIGCGAYGLPLAARIKRMGKIAIHMGGSTQILFGIKGARWDNHDIVSRFYNEAWVRPLDEDKPEGFGSVENGCYW